MGGPKAKQKANTHTTLIDWNLRKRGSSYSRGFRLTGSRLLYFPYPSFLFGSSWKGRLFFALAEQYIFSFFFSFFFWLFFMCSTSSFQPFVFVAVISGWSASFSSLLVITLGLIGLCVELCIMLRWIESFVRYS